MSLINDNRVHKRKVVTLKDQCKLIIPAHIKEQIDYLHNSVKRNTEWSAILIYDVVSGEISDPKDWVIQIEELIPMDVGTGSYTEYEIRPDDEYASEIWMDALADGKRMGHLHTHHNMNCFFSGTDMSELHDNAPKHAFYLSLIVNYAGPDEWIAKVAITGETKKVGTRKIESTVITTRSWAAAESVNQYTEDPISEIEVNEVEELLYTINCNLEVQETDAISEEFKARVEEIKKPKRSYHYNGGYGNYGGNSVGFQKSLFPTGVSLNHVNAQNVEKRKENTVGALFHHLENNSYDSFDEEDISSKEPGCFSRANVLPLLLDMIPVNGLAVKELSQAVIAMENLNSAELENYLDTLDAQFENIVDTHFEIDSNYIDLHCIAVSCKEALLPYQNSQLYAGIALILEERILPEYIIPRAITNKLTGIEDTELDQILI